MPNVADYLPSQKRGGAILLGQNYRRRGGFAPILGIIPLRCGLLTNFSPACFNPRFVGGNLAVTHISTGRNIIGEMCAPQPGFSKNGGGRDTIKRGGEE